MRNQGVNKIFLKNATVHFGIVVGENSGLLLVKNFSDDLDLDGYSYINKSKIKKISSQGKKSKFYQKICELRYGSWEEKVELHAESMKELASMLTSVISIDYLNKCGKSVFFVGFIEIIEKNHLGARYVSPLGAVEEHKLDMIRYDDIIKIQVGGRYLDAFNLYGEHKKFESSGFMPRRLQRKKQ